MSLAHKDRISELDSLKALALVMMLISNFVSDLSFFKIMEVTEGDHWWYLARATASLFVCISGISYYLANRENPSLARVFLRTKKLIFWAFIITIVTYFF
ncbi:MAG: heparan-alpha-glucosaminide N-acetyltransferase domain-containing protein, partial [Candidatus Thermoplasmatota archaeon]|nr:heparan-alpha-glucosaminide N-acetyltransferase domain-containing protein [Candidatus Thermoplasmatota archaeon]